MIKNTLLALMISLGGVNALAATELENLKSSAGNALSVDVNIEEIRNVLVTDPAAPGRNNTLVIFLGSSAYGGASGSGSLLAKLGVRKEAEEAALAKCRKQFFSGCAVIGSAADPMDSKGLAATGMAMSFAPFPGAASVSAQATWNGYGDLSVIEKKGVLKSAEDAAVAKCRAQSHSVCVATGSALGVCDSTACAATGRAQARFPARP